LTIEVLTAIVSRKVIEMVDKKTREDMTTIWVEKEVAEMLKDLGRMGDTYSAVIRRLLDGRKPEEKERPQGDE